MFGLNEIYNFKIVEISYVNSEYESSEIAQSAHGFTVLGMLPLLKELREKNPNKTYQLYVEVDV